MSRPRSTHPLPRDPGRLLRMLERAVTTFGEDAAGRKRALLRSLRHRRLPNAAAVSRLHEALCFLRAYPDDAAVLRDVVAMLDGFEARSDLRRDRVALTDSGIAGTSIHYGFFWFTALWLARRWPAALEIDWPVFDNADDLEPLLRLLVPYAEAAAMDDVDRSPRRWIEAMRGAGETDATFLVRRFQALRVDGFLREMLYERIDPPLRLRTGGELPSRTRAFVPGSPIVFRTRALDRARPDLRRAARDRPRAMRAVSGRMAQSLIDRARESMVTRSRDLDSFEHADTRDVRIVDCDDGLQLACIGLLPERRALFDSIYGYLTLQNGVPIGYVLTSALFGSSLVAYNIFETFRGGEAARNYGRILGAVRSLFDCDTFGVDPYQLGHDNAEGLASGAWWFYYKLGFRPVDPHVRRLVRREVARLAAHPRARSTRATLQQLSVAHVFFHLGRPRADVLGRVTLGNVSLRVSTFLARRYGADREAGVQECAERAGSLLGVRSRRSWATGEKLIWERWAPVVLLLPGVELWSRSEKDDLVSVIRAKGGHRESDFVPLFDSHRKLRRAVLGLARPPA